MADVVGLDNAAAESYADVLTLTATAVADSDLARALDALAPIAGERWTVRVQRVGTGGPTGVVPGRREMKDATRAQVFVRDGFRCVGCGARAVPRCILVAFSDLFPDALPYHPNYKHGEIHPVYWILAPEADHVLAHARGGPGDIDNLATLHAICNTRKSDSLVEVSRPGMSGDWIPWKDQSHGTSQ